MEPGTKDTYDFECVDCEHQFDVADAVLLNAHLICPKCKSENIVELGEQ